MARAKGLDTKESVWALGRQWNLQDWKHWQSLKQGHLSNSPITTLIISNFKLPVLCILSTSDKLCWTAFCARIKADWRKKKLKFLNLHLLTYLHKSCHQAQAAAPEKDSGSAPPLSARHSHTDSLPSGKKGHLQKNEWTHSDKDYDQCYKVTENFGELRHHIFMIKVGKCLYPSKRKNIC